jgi:hypothetical protein
MSTLCLTYRGAQNELSILAVRDTDISVCPACLLRSLLRRVMPFRISRFADSRVKLRQLIFRLEPVPPLIIYRWRVTSAIHGPRLPTLDSIFECAYMDQVFSCNSSPKWLIKPIAALKISTPHCRCSHLHLWAKNGHRKEELPLFL